MTAKLIRWRGGPGAGKSSTLIDYCRREVAAGAKIEDLTVMSFSRTQAHDLARRLHDQVFPRTDETAIRERVATIDAHALRTCRTAGLIADPHGQVIQHPPETSETAVIYQSFMKRCGLDYNPAININNDDGLPRADLPLGNKLVSVNAFLSSVMLSPDDWRIAARELGIPVPGHAWPITHLLKSWADYKTRLDVFEHADYVRLALDRELPPPSTILIVDEFQDVSPLQAALIKHWIAHPDTRRVYVAGDADQSIYGFRGCDPRLFHDLPAEDRGARSDGNRPTSHRCPIAIMGTAERILGRPANVLPCNRTGRVHLFRPKTATDLAAQVEEAIRYIRTLPGKQQPIFILSRFRKGAGDLAADLSATGIPCSGIKPGRIKFWTTERIGRTPSPLETATINLWTLKTAIGLYLSGCDTDPIPPDAAAALITATLPGESRDAALTDIKLKSKSGTIRLYDIHGWLGGNLRGRIFDKLLLQPEIVKRIHACLLRERRRGYEISPDAVRIDTIHAAKGLEASVVLLHTGYLKGRLDDLRAPVRRAEERRVYFVGATRASRVLLILDYGQGPTCPLLAGVVP